MARCSACGRTGHNIRTCGLAEIASERGGRAHEAAPFRPRRRRSGEPRWSELESSDPRWRARCRPLLDFLTLPRTRCEINLWGRARRLTFVEIDQQWSWLDTQGLIARDEKGRWVATGQEGPRPIALYSEDGTRTEYRSRI